MKIKRDSSAFLLVCFLLKVNCKVLCKTLRFRTVYIYRQYINCWQSANKDTQPVQGRNQYLYKENTITIKIVDHHREWTGVILIIIATLHSPALL